MIKLTIHTATYNRAYILGQAYESLKQQSCKDFEWIITDDGSTDETEKMVEGWILEDSGFPIVYNKLEHVGIPRALNSGIHLASSDWFMMLDSDDYIVPDAVKKIICWLKEIDEKTDFVGIGYARCFPDGSYMKPQEPIIDSKLGFIDISNIERPMYHLDMDMTEVYRVRLLKQYPFQYWPTEKYAPEQLSLNKLALDGYKLRWRKDKLYVCDYLDDGQTKDNRLVMNNPMGFAMMHNQNLLIHKSFKKKCFDAAQMIALCLYSKNPKYLRESNAKSITAIMLPVGWAISLRRRRQFRELQVKQ